jgi:DNA-directed RNA polymerase specialized sigma24 family protein
MNEDDLWAEYSRLSEQADSDRLNDMAWATDEALDIVLERIAASRAIAPQTVANLVRNRARKHRRRRAILARNATLFPTTAANDNARHDALDVLNRSATVLTSLEARLLFGIGEGKTYGELARSEGAPEATIKTWVRRARMKIKH